MEDSDLQQVQQIVDQSIQRYTSDSRFNVVSIPAHQHTGVDSNKVDASSITNLNIPNIGRIFSTTSTGNWATGSTAVQNTFVPNANMIDVFDVSSATGAVTFSNPVGSPANGQILRVRVTSSNSATARALTWSSSTGGYASANSALPSATTTGQTLDVGFQYDTTNSLNKWRLIYSVASLIPKIVTNDVTGQSASNTSVVTVTSPNDGVSHTYLVGGYITVTAISVNTLTLQATYTDETNTSRTQSFFGEGLTTAAVSTTGGFAFPPITVRSYPNTAVTVKTVVAGAGSDTYDVGGFIQTMN